MDIKTAIELIESGRFEEIDIEDLWDIINVLSSSPDPQAFQALVKLQNSKVGQSLPQLNMQMKYIIEQNAQAVSRLENSFNLFELDKKGRPIHNEILPIFNFFEKIEIENKEDAEPVKKQDLFMQAAEVAKLTAKKDIYLNKNFSRLPAEEQKKSYIASVRMAMEESAFVLVSNQILEDDFTRQRKQETQEKPKEAIPNITEKKITQRAEEEFEKIINPQSTKSFKLSNRNIISTLISEVNRTDKKALLTQENTLSKDLSKKVKEVDKLISKQYPETSRLLRPLAAYQYIGILAGKAGKNMFSADMIAETVHNYNPVKDQKDVSLFTFLREQPAKLKVFSRHIVVSVKKAYTTIREALQHGFSGEKFATGLKQMFAFFTKQGPEAKYKGMGSKTVQGNLRIVSAELSQVLNRSNTDSRYIAWRNFGQMLNKSQLGRVLDPEKTALVSENFDDYTTVTMIELNKKPSLIKKAKPQKISNPLKMIARAIMSEKNVRK